MSPYRKNIMVGAVVMVAMLMMAWLVLKFGSKSAAIFAPPEIGVHFTCDRADGLSDGSDVLYRGVSIGRVTAVKLKGDGSGVIIDSVISRSQPIPSNIDATIRQTSLLGSVAVINLEPPDGAAPAQPLIAGATVQARFSGLRFDELQRSIVQTSDEMALTLKQFRDSNSVNDLDAAIRQIDAQVKRVGDQVAITLQNFNDKNVVGDLDQTIRHTDAALTKVTDDLHKTLGDLSVTITTTGKHEDEIAKEIAGTMEETSKVLKDVQSITAKIDSGKGTAGELVNDPRLYESLVESATKLDATVSDLQRLVEQWEQEGLIIKMH